MFQQEQQYSNNRHKTQQSLKLKQKQIYLIQNGSPNKILTYQYKHQINKQQVQKICQKNWDIKIKSIRFFTIDGVQYETQDINFIKNKQRLYISRGQDFNNEMNFGEYKIIKTLGEGGFGKVMLAQNIITKQLAAVKIIKVQKIYGASDIDMIFRQIENLKALNHPNIVKIINCYILKNMQVYVVMEYLQGGQLLQLLRERKFLPEEEAKHYFNQIISAVYYCHRQNIIHRDLKVQNILFKSREEKIIKIADFGISGVADQFNPDFDAGTLKYMAPQVLSAKQKSNNPAVDVWACGVILYYMLCGCLPFNGNSNSQIINAICQGKYIFPKQRQISDQCKDLIANILNVNPKKRLKMEEIKDHSWLAREYFKTKKQLSLKLQRSFQQQKDSIVENQSSQQLQLIKKKSLNSQKSEIQSIMQKRVKAARKSLYYPRNERKSQNTLIQIPKRLQKQKQQILDQLQSYNNKYNNGHNFNNNSYNMINNNLNSYQRQKQKQKRNLFRGSGLMIAGGGIKQIYQQMYQKGIGGSNNNIGGSNGSINSGGNNNNNNNNSNNNININNNNNNNNNNALINNGFSTPIGIISSHNSNNNLNFLPQSNNQINCSQQLPNINKQTKIIINSNNNVYNNNLNNNCNNNKMRKSKSKQFYRSSNVMLNNNNNHRDIKDKDNKSNHKRQNDKSRQSKDNKIKKKQIIYGWK